MLSVAVSVAELAMIRVNPALVRVEGQTLTLLEGFT